MAAGTVSVVEPPVVVVDPPVVVLSAEVEAGVVEASALGRAIAPERASPPIADWPPGTAPVVPFSVGVTGV
jgi:hypothetical protein